MLPLQLSLMPLLPLLSLTSAYPLSFYQPPDSPFARLFARQSPPPAVGSDAWTAMYPQASGTPTNVTQSWLDALNAAVSKGLIPNISQSTMDSSGTTVYPDGGDPTSSTICSFTYQCNATDDIVNPPAGVIALSFDDGPLAGPSDTLYSYLQNNSQHATHFMIGVNILWNPTQFLTAFNTNKDHIAVHTWSHPYLTTLSNEQVVAELGWTIQIISDSTGGLIPSCYRPPYGDTDNRIRAIAKEVFGLKTVTWNQDSEDWSIGTSTTLDAVEWSLKNWVVEGGAVGGQGLEILEHELMPETVEAFMSIYPSMKANWTVKPVADAFNFSWYQNGDNSDAAPQFSLGVASPIPTFTSISQASLPTNANGTHLSNTVTATASVGPFPTNNLGKSGASRTGVGKGVALLAVVGVGMMLLA